MASPSPILIVGALRSGTTMFRLMLGHHSRVGYAEEFEFGFDRLGDEGYPELEGFYRYLETHRAFGDHRFEADRSLSFPDLLRDFLRQAWERSGKPEVAAVIHSAFHRAPELWPDARFVHVLRDPRDVANSCVAMGWAGNPYYGVDVWITAERRWDALCRTVEAGRRHEVRYEELIDAPEETLRGVCAFLSLPYEANMLSYPGDTTYSAPDARFASQWRARMSPRDVARVEQKCGGLLQARGYEPGAARIRIAPPERLYLMLSHRARRARQSIRRYGPGLWALERVAKLVGSEVLRKRVKLRKNAIDRLHLK